MAASEEALTNVGQAKEESGTGEQSSPVVNVGQTERWASAIGGGALALYGITRGSLGGIALALVGAALGQRGCSGHCNLYEALGYSSAGAASLRNSEHASL